MMRNHAEINKINSFTIFVTDVTDVTDVNTHSRAYHLISSRNNIILTSSIKTDGVCASSPILLSNPMDSHKIVKKRICGY